MAWLQVKKGLLEGETVDLQPVSVVLGREKGSVDVVISNKDIVSRKHAKIFRVNERFFVEDLDSRNDTYLNGSKIPKNVPVALKQSDRINICDDEFEALFLETAVDENAGENSSTVEAMLSSKSDHSLESQPAARLAFLLEITAKLSQTLQLDIQLPQVADSLLQLFPQADRCFLILVHEGTGKLLPKVIRTRSKLDETAARFSKSIVNQCLNSVQAILLREGDAMPLLTNVSDSVIASNMRSVMCVPLCPAEGKPFGVIQLDTQDAAKKFTGDDLRLLWGVAHQATIAMENARFHEESLAQERVKNELEMARQSELREVRFAQDKVKNELDIARQVQLNFLPKHLPDVPGYEFYAYYEAAREVGGDYYDFIPLPERRLAVTLGDVAGKGMPAALLMAKLSSESRSCLLTERQPTAALARLNEQLYPFTSPMDRFITLVAAILDPATHTLTLVNAGHPAPLWYRHAERKFTKAILHDDDGQSLGIAEGSKYQSYQFKLEPGDSLLLFSDGVTDAQNVANKSFRLKGIYNVLEHAASDTPRALGERVVEAVQRHALGGPQYDDITLLCFGRPLR